MLLLRYIEPWSLMGAFPLTNTETETDTDTDTMDTDPMGIYACIVSVEYEHFQKNLHKPFLSVSVLVWVSGVVNTP